MEVSSFQGETLDSFSYSLGIDLDSEVKEQNKQYSNCSTRAKNKH
jgi:hypothetical protein